MKCTTLQDAIDRYGPIENGVWADEAKWMTVIPIPADISATWLNTNNNNQPTIHIYGNKDMTDALLAALDAVRAAGIIDQLKTFDGCFNIRPVRGMNSISTHAYGLGIDMNAADYPLGSDARMSDELVACFKNAGFDYGGDFVSRKDAMHISYAFEVPGGSS